MSGSTIFNSKGEELFTRSNPAFATVHSTSSDTFNQTFPFKSGSTLFSSNGQELFTEENPAFLVVDGVPSEEDVEEIKRQIEPLLRGQLVSETTVQMISQDGTTGRRIIFFSSSFLGVQESNNTNVDLGRPNGRFRDIYFLSLRPSANSNIIWSSFSGNPNGRISASVGSMGLDINGGSNSVLYIKESGTGNTGWVAK